MAMIGARPTPSLGGAVPTSLGVAPALLPGDGGFPQLPQLTAPKKQGINWLGVLADALSGAAGQPGMYAQRMYHDRQDQTDFERGETQWKAHHAQELRDQMSLLDYKRLHPDDPMSQMLDLAGVNDPTQRQGYFLKALNKRADDDPIVTLTLPGDRIYSGPRSGLSTALTGGSSPLSNDVPAVTDEAGYNALPPGARFKSPDGHIRVKGGQTGSAPSGNFR